MPMATVFIGVGRAGFSFRVYNVSLACSMFHALLDDTVLYYYHSRLEGGPWVFVPHRFSTILLAAA